jgi:predicted amidohydrolase YtcJ
MKKTLTFALGFALLSTAAVFAAAAPGSAPDKADLVIRNAKIFTGWDVRPWAEAIAAKEGKIAAVGTDDEIAVWIGPQTRVVDAEKRLVIPGLIDAHTHFCAGGRSLIELSFRGVRSVEKIREMVAAKIKELPPGTAVFGGEYDHSLFPGGRWPTKADLDPVSPDNPVVIERVDGHSVWVNNLALAQSGIGKTTPNPFGGEILKDPETGEPTGILTEAATGLLKVKRPVVKSTPEEDIRRALEHAAKLGLTGVHTSATLSEFAIFRKLRDQGSLTLRMYAWLPIDGLDGYIARNIRRGQGDDLLRVGFLKIFIDGTLGSGTALLFAPFSDEPEKSGLPQYPEETFDALIAKAHQNGYQTGTHAIGDKGVHWVLDAVEKAERAFGMKDLRHRIEHAQIVAPSDFARFKKLGVIASMQPTHCTTDLRFCERRIGRERSKNAYAWRTLLDAGARIAFGSDWPVEPLDPMRGLYSAVTRKSIEFDIPEGGWFPEQKLTMAEAIGLFTAGAAFASFEENLKGTLEPGKLADFVLLSKDLFTIEPREILTTEALLTVLGGRVVYEKK